MYNNKLYNTRNSNRYNNAGQFMAPVPGEPQQQYQGNPRRQQHQQQQQQQVQPPPPPQPQMIQSNLQEVPIQDDVDMKPSVAELEDEASKQEDRPAWMKSKLGGVKKVSNKERRRRQNETLRRLLTPKNALMVLNEMMPRDHIANQFTVEAAQSQFYSRNSLSFCADLTLEGTNYKGYGENKLSARNSAAEQAIRDLIIKRMNKAVAAGAPAGAVDGAAEAGEEEALPMIQLASFALHKLFTEWEVEGHKVPQLRGSGASVSESVASAECPPAEAGGPPGPAPPAPGPRPPPPRAAKPRALPAAAGAMHPSMLLSYMRPGVLYRELPAAGDKPQNMVFTMAVDVDGVTYTGKASNKKDARKAAARAAITALYPGVLPAEA